MGEGEGEIGVLSRRNGGGAIRGGTDGEARTHRGGPDADADRCPARFLPSARAETSSDTNVVRHM